MAKLSMSMKTSIVNKLMEPFHKVNEENLNKVEEHIRTLLKEKIPKEILDMNEKYPQYFKEGYGCYFHFSEYGYPKDFYKRSYIAIDVKGLPIASWKSIDASMIDFTGKNKELFTKYMKAYVESDNNASEMDKKLKCVFGSINTTKQLEMEFPEAFKIYKKLMNAPVVDEKGNKCDKIEEVRALIGKVE